MVFHVENAEVRRRILGSKERDVHQFSQESLDIPSSARWTSDLGPFFDRTPRFPALRRSTRAELDGARPAEKPSVACERARGQVPGKRPRTGSNRSRRERSAWRMPSHLFSGPCPQHSPPLEISGFLDILPAQDPGRRTRHPKVSWTLSSPRSARSATPRGFGSSPCSRREPST